MQSSTPDVPIWVAAGTYKPTTGGDRWAHFRLLAQRRLYGGFAGTESSLEERAGLFHSTILSGDVLGDDGPGFVNVGDNSFNVVKIGPGSPTIDGFTIVGGNSLPSANGGGIVSNGPVRARIENCTFRANRAYQSGGGLFLHNAEGSLVRRCTFIGNQASDGGGAAAFALDEPIRIVSCRFLGNSAGDDGGGLDTRAACHVIDCEFSGNTAFTGGGLSGSGPFIQSCSFVGNSATFQGGGIYVFDSRLHGCVLWDNTDPTGWHEAMHVFGSWIDYCCVQGWTDVVSAVTKVYGDPRFVDADGPDDVFGTLDDDLRLGAGSSCIDTGGVPMPEVSMPTRDLGMSRRLVDSLACDAGGVLDIGARERQEVDGSTSFCAQPPTSLGVPAEIGAPCVVSVTGGVLYVRVGPVPSATGRIFCASEIASKPFGTDTLCLGGRLLRLPDPVKSADYLGLSLELADPPGTLLLPGSTWHFQALFRDGGSLRLSDATSITFRD